MIRSPDLHAILLCTLCSLCAMCLPLEVCWCPAHALCHAYVAPRMHCSCALDPECTHTLPELPTLAALAGMHHMQQMPPTVFDPHGCRAWLFVPAACTARDPHPGCLAGMHYMHRTLPQAFLMALLWLAAADRCGGHCGGAPQAGVLNACGHMYLDAGEEMNMTRSLNNYLSLAAQQVLQVWGCPAPLC